MEPRSTIHHSPPEVPATVGKQNKKNNARFNTGCSTRTPKPVFRGPDLRSRSMWTRVRLSHAARSKRSCQIRIKTRSCPCVGKAIYGDPQRLPVWRQSNLQISTEVTRVEAKRSTEIHIGSRSRAPCVAPHC